MATNTEKPTTKTEQKKQGLVQTPKNDKKNIEKAPVQKPEKKKTEDKNIENPESETKKEEPKKQAKKQKKEFVVVNGANIPVSTKYSVAICKFVKGKKINDAIKDLEQVIALKKAVPMKGEIPHRKGKMMSGRYPARSARAFIPLLKSLGGNATNHEIENPVIYEASANKAMRPMARFGSWQRKRTHITIKAREMKIKENKKTKVEEKK